MLTHVAPFNAKLFELPFLAGRKKELFGWPGSEFWLTEAKAVLICCFVCLG